MSINQLLRPGDIPSIIFKANKIFFAKVNGAMSHAGRAKTGREY